MPLESHLVSVIIPTLQEAAGIAATIAAVRAAGPREIIVVDGGSTDETWSAAESADLRLQATGGRGPQLNRGAVAATGDVLLFLHADCRLPSDGLTAIAAVMSDPRVVGGCFQQRIEATGWQYPWIAAGNALRARWLHMPYGDQAIFVRRDVFQTVGGFPDIPLMEDVYFGRRLARQFLSRSPFRKGASHRFVVLPQQIGVSARRWRRRGVWRQTLTNWRLLAAAYWGVPPTELLKRYPPVRDS